MKADQKTFKMVPGNNFLPSKTSEMAQFTKLYFFPIFIKLSDYFDFSFFFYFNSKSMHRKVVDYRFSYRNRVFCPINYFFTEFLEVQAILIPTFIEKSYRILSPLMYSHIISNIIVYSA